MLLKVWKGSTTVPKSLEMVPADGSSGAGGHKSEPHQAPNEAGRINAPTTASTSSPLLPVFLDTGRADGWASLRPAESAEGGGGEEHPPLSASRLFCRRRYWEERLESERGDGKASVRATVIDMGVWG